jgi:hypothetical protein
MGLPRQVQRQVEAVEQFDKAVAEAENKPPAQTTDEQGETQPPAEEAHKPEATAPPPAKQPDEASVWKQRFQTLQGMFNSQVPNLQQQVRDLTARIEALSTRPAETEPPPSSELVTKNDVDSFGADLVDLVRRGAREEVQRVSTQYEGKIAKLESELAEARKSVGAVSQMQEQSASEAFFAGLDSTIPKWREIQETAECQAWLSSPVPGSTTEWNEVLVNAANRFDLNAVKQVFGEFFSKHPQLAPQQPRRQQQPPAPSKARSELERQVAPTKAGSQGAPSSSEKRLYTGREYEAESMRLVRMAQQGKHDEAARLEAELNSALAEGRVR